MLLHSIEVNGDRTNYKKKLLSTVLHQSSAMACGINVIVALLACATAASAVSAPFPHGDTLVYRYHTVVTTSVSEQGPYSSQFALEGTLDVTHDTRDPELVNAFNVVLSNVATDMHNGKTVDYDGKSVLQSIDSAASVIQEPFLIIYNANGTLHGVKIDKNEPEWSKNMKMAMATMLQLDLANINVANIPHSFVSQEKTIHGDCSVTYNVYPSDRVNSNIAEGFSVNKTYSPMECVGFSVQEFSNVDNELRKGKKDHRMLTDSIRNFEIEKQGEGILIKKLVAYGVVSVISSTGASYPYFVMTNSTFEFLRSKGKSENDRSLGNFSSSPVIRDVIYRKPQTSYAPNAAIDVTQGRHVVNLTSLPLQLEKLLVEAVDYIEENHFGPKGIDWNRARTINKILHTMSYMDADALQATFGILENMVYPSAEQIKNIFLSIVSQVGTPASCHFTRNIILNKKIPTLRAIDMLINLPLSVKAPTTELLKQMEDLTKFDDSISANVTKAGILSFSTLIYRTFKHESRPEDNTILSKYLHDFFDHVKNEPNDDMKVVYLMAIKNVQVGKIYNLLKPIIDGSLAISENPERIRLLAIWAIDKAVEEDYSIALSHLWPVMANTTLPAKLRIAAYEILIKQATDKNSITKVHQYVSSEGNEHFYNYHYTTLDSIAKSADQSKLNIRTIVRSILETMNIPQTTNTHYPVSGVFSASTVDNDYNYAEKIDVGVVVNELTGAPEVLQFEHVVVDNDGAVSEIAMKVHIEGYQEIMSLLGFLYHGNPLTLTTVRELLEQAARLLPAPKNLLVDIILMRKGRVFIADRYGYNNINRIPKDVEDYFYTQFYETPSNSAINYQNVVFNRLYEIQLTSDIGVPVIVETRVPIVNSLKFNLTVLEIFPSPADVTFEIKRWMHGEHSMSVYNPMKDTWHAIRSVKATEVSLPFRTVISPGPDSDVFFTLSFPERPETVSPVAGYLILGKHIVTVDEEGTRALMESCPTCNHQEYVRDSSLEENSSETYGWKSIDSKGIGLKSSACAYKCEYGFMSEVYLGYTTDWNRSYFSNVQNKWHEAVLQGIMLTRRQLANSVLDMQMRSCGIILKSEPSTDYPISHINVYKDSYYEDLDINETNHELLHAKNYKFGVAFDMISNLTNTTAQLWKIGVHFNTDRGHLVNNASIKITRKTPEEKDLKICIDTKKIYPVAPADDLKIGETNEEIDSELIIAYGYTNEEGCVRNETSISMKMKAQLSDEQKNRLKHDMENSACSKDRKDPLYASSKNFVPRTINCLNEAIRYTTPRMYTIDVTHNKLPQGFADFMYRSFTDHHEPSQSGNFKLQAEFSMEANGIEFQLMTNTRDFTTYNICLNDLLPDGRGPVLNPLWDFPLDNSRFNLKHLHDYTYDDIRICSVFPKIVLTDDGAKTPYTIPSDSWTLISGDHADKIFAIFAKQPRPNYLSFLVFINDEQAVHFYTRESDGALVAMTDGMEPKTEGSFRLPQDEGFGWSLKVTKRNDHFVVRTRREFTTLVIGANYISVMFDSELQGSVSGLCGYLNGTTLAGIPQIYSTKDINELAILKND